MTELLTAAQMQSIERSAIDAGEVTGLELMERAGAGVVDAILEAWPDMESNPPRTVVLCGPGNNGGDGFVIARLLREREWPVRVFLYGDPDKLPPDAATNYERWRALGPVDQLSDKSLGTVQSPPELVVDALFGTGLARPIEGEADFVLSNLENLQREFDVKCVAVDIPSGICSDSGKALRSHPLVDLTVSFHAEKLGHCLHNADTHSRRVVVKDIGLPHAERVAQRSSYVWKVEPPEAASLAKAGTGQKYVHGHALIVSGRAGHSGAARLAARAALRVGAGLVTLAVPRSAQAEVAGRITALMMRKMKNAADLTDLLWDTRLNTVCIGPGLGLTDWARSLVEAVLPLGRPVVLDADALTMFQHEPKALFELTHERCVLTPHGGEFARLFPDLAKKLNAEPKKGPAYSKVDATRAAARRAGCVVLFKGPDTVVAAPNGHCAIHSAQFDRAAPWLATAGAGDVLAGMITGLIARGFSPMEACETGAWLHTEAALETGPGLIAEDLPEKLPIVFAKMGL